MTTIITFFQALFHKDILGWRVDREIFNRVFAHLNRLENHGYPFATDDELHAHGMENISEVGTSLESTERTIQAMPEAYGMAFRYLMYRSIKREIQKWQTLSHSRVPQAKRAALQAHFVHS